MPSSLHMGISVKLLSIRYGVTLLAERWQLPALWGGGKYGNQSRKMHA